MMRDLVLCIVKSLVEDSDNVEVREVMGEKTTVVEIKVPAGDRGKIIGKQGKIIKAIRCIVHSASAKLDKRATVEIVE